VWPRVQDLAIAAARPAPGRPRTGAGCLRPTRWTRTRPSPPRPSSASGPPSALAALAAEATEAATRSAADHAVLPLSRRARRKVLNQGRPAPHAVVTIHSRPGGHSTGAGAAAPQPGVRPGAGEVSETDTASAQERTPGPGRSVFDRRRWPLPAHTRTGRRRAGRDEQASRSCSPRGAIDGNVNPLNPVGPGPRRGRWRAPVLAPESLRILAALRGGSARAPRGFGLIVRRFQRPGAGDAFEHSGRSSAGRRSTRLTRSGMMPA